MKIMKYSLLLGVASAFLLSSNLSAEESEEPVIGSLFDNVDSSARFDDTKPQLTTNEVNTASESSVETPQMPQQNAEGANAGPIVEVQESVIESALKATDDAIKAAVEAKKALEQSTLEAQKQEEAKQAEIAAKKKAEEDAAEHERLKKLTPEDHRKAAEETVLADNQHKYATFLGMEDGAVNIDSTHENEVNAAQAEELSKIGIGKDITTKIVEQEAVASTNAEAVAENAPATAAANAGADEEKADKKDDATAETPANVDQQDQAASNGKKAKKPRKKLNDEEKAAHEERMKKQKEDSEAKKASKKEANAKNKEEQLADKDKKGEKRKKKKEKEEQIAKKKEEGKAIKAERAKRKKENEDKDYTELLNEGETPQEIEQSN